VLLSPTQGTLKYIIIRQWLIQRKAPWVSKFGLIIFPLTYSHVYINHHNWVQTHLKLRTMNNYCLQVSLNEIHYNWETNLARFHGDSQLLVNSSNSLLLSVFINHSFDEELSSFVRGTHHRSRRHVSEAHFKSQLAILLKSLGGDEF